MPDENRPNTRGRVDNRKDLDTYFKSEAFATLIKKSITEKFERLLRSEDFKDMLVSRWWNQRWDGGGIGFYIRDTLNYRVRSDLNNTDIEVLTIEISKYKTKPFLVTTWYRPPNTPIEKFQEFEKLLQYIDLEDKESIILGDLNCDLIPEFTNDCNTNELNFVTNMYQYKQLIQEPTRVTRNTKSLIDHLFTNKPENIILTGVSKIAISDHYLIYGVRKFPSLKENTRIIEFWEFKNLNERAFLDDIRSISTLNLHQEQL